LNPPQLNKRIRKNIMAERRKIGISGNTIVIYDCNFFLPNVIINTQ